MRIGNHEITPGKSAPHARDTIKGKKAGAASTVPEEKGLAALNAYEEYQRTAFEAVYWDKDTDWLRSREREVPRTTDGLDEMRVRRNRAEAWAIARILKRRGQ
jgi:hypothetical protein